MDILSRLERTVAIFLSKSGIEPMFGNSSSKKFTGTGHTPPFISAYSTKSINNDVKKDDDKKFKALCWSHIIQKYAQGCFAGKTKSISSLAVISRITSF